MSPTLRTRLTYFSWGGCFWAPGPEVAGMGPGWKAWLGEVLAERALWGEPWADWDGEAEAERFPPEHQTHTLYRHTHHIQTHTRVDTHIVYKDIHICKDARAHTHTQSNTYAHTSTHTCMFREVVLLASCWVRGCVERGRPTLGSSWLRALRLCLRDDIRNIMFKLHTSYSYQSSICTVYVLMQCIFSIPFR